MNKIFNSTARWYLEIGYAATIAVAGISLIITATVEALLKFTISNNEYIIYAQLLMYITGLLLVLIAGVYLNSQNKLRAKIISDIIKLENQHPGSIDTLNKIHSQLFK